MKFQIGDRVKVYGHIPLEVATEATFYSRGVRGTISSIVNDNEVVIDYDNGTASEVHPKQCRKLVSPATKFKPEDFEAAFGITYHDYTTKQHNLTWREICERAADAANDKYNEEWKLFGPVLENLLKELKS